MGVPYTGSYEMFGATTTESIAGGVEAGGGTITGITEFSGSTSSLISSSYISKFDELSIRGARTISDISQSLQYRGYPINDCIISASTVEVFLNDIEVVFSTTFMSRIASGSVEVNSIESTDFVRVGTTEGAIVGATASAYQNSTFRGWRTTPITIGSSTFGLGRIMANYNLAINKISDLSENTFTIPDVNDSSQTITYYAVFDSNITKRTYCYNSNNDLNDICFRCAQKVNVYFNKSDYTGSAITDLDWYNDSLLTTNVNDGYYYISGSINPSVYKLESGTAAYYNNCDGTTIVCS